jgi:hypothetical protein
MTRARTGDPALIREINLSLILNLGLGLAILVNAPNRQMLKFGGILSLAKEFIMPSIFRNPRKEVMRSIRFLI